MRRIAATIALALAGCSGVTDLEKPQPPLQGNEPAAVRRKVDEAVQAKKFSDAWDLEARAGTDRARLENIAMTSLEADSGPYEDMIAQLRKKFGGLSPTARARVDAATSAAESNRKWTRAVEIQIDAADDPPAFKGAWAVYDRTPPKDALAVLEAITKARDDLKEASAASPK